MASVSVAQADGAAINTTEPFDGRALRQCFGQFATGVTVVTTEFQGTLYGVTANSFSSVSLDPPLILWSLRREASAFEPFTTSSHFCVNVLSAEQTDIAQKFAASGGDKFAGVDWQPGKGGAPVLAGGTVTFECSLEAKLDGGDHVIILGRVLRFARHDREGLVFARGRFALTREHPGREIAQPARASGRRSDVAPDFLLQLLFHAYNSVSDSFDRHRRAEGITTNQGRILAFLYDIASASAGEIAGATYLGESAAEDTVRDLIGEGLAIKGVDGTVALTEAGRARREALARHFDTFEAEEIAGLTSEDVAATKRVLRALSRRSSGKTGA